MNSCAVFCSMSCPRVSCAFATSAGSPTATVPNYSICAVPICGPVHHRPLPSALGISAHTAVVGPCASWRHSLLPNSPHGCPMPLQRRTLHDPPLGCEIIPTGRLSGPHPDQGESVYHPCSRRSRCSSQLLLLSYP